MGKQGRMIICAECGQKKRIFHWVLGKDETQQWCDDCIKAEDASRPAPIGGFLHKTPPRYMQ